MFWLRLLQSETLICFHTFPLVFPLWWLNQSLFSHLQLLLVDLLDWLSLNQCMDQIWRANQAHLFCNQEKWLWVPLISIGLEHFHSSHTFKRQKFINEARQTRTLSLLLFKFRNNIMRATVLIVTTRHICQRDKWRCRLMAFPLTHFAAWSRCIIHLLLCGGRRHEWYYTLI